MKTLGFRYDIMHSGGVGELQDVVIRYPDHDGNDLEHKVRLPPQATKALVARLGGEGEGEGDEDVQCVLVVKPIEPARMR